MKHTVSKTSIVGLITIGQTPRPDIEALYQAYLPESTLLIRGLLDGMSREEIKALVEYSDEYPLRVVLNDGSRVEISLKALHPLLKIQVEKLAGEGIQFAVLLCCGDFPKAESTLPILYPSVIIPAILESICKKKCIGIILPNTGQIKPAQQHWTKKGFSVHATACPPRNLKLLKEEALRIALHKPGMVVLDCMGFGDKDRQVVQEYVDCPVILPASLIAKVAAELIGQPIDILV